MSTAHLELQPSGGEPAQLHGLLKRPPDLVSVNPVTDDPATDSADERS
jgi:hypothetical protein